MAYKTFANGFPLPASDLNNFLMDQSVIVFANSTARDTDIPTPTEGMVSYLEDSDSLELWTGAAWEIVNDNSASIPKSTVTTAGDLIVADGASSVTRLGVGTSGKFLSSNGSSVLWDDAPTPDLTTLIPKSIVDAAGDLIYATADDTPARLPKGTNGQVLTAGASTIAWQDLSAGGMSLLTSTSITGVTNVSVTGINQGFENLTIALKRFYPPNSTSRSISLKFFNNSTQLDVASLRFYPGGDDNRIDSSLDPVYGVGSGGVGASKGNQHAWTLTLQGYSDARPSTFSGSYFVYSGGDGTNPVTEAQAGTITNNLAINRIDIALSSEFSGGELEIWGIK